MEALISPGSTVSFVLMENHAHVELLGASRDSRDPNSKFTISGDFSHMAADFEGALRSSQGRGIYGHRRKSQLNFWTVSA